MFVFNNFNSSYLFRQDVEVTCYSYVITGKSQSERMTWFREWVLKGIRSDESRLFITFFFCYRYFHRSSRLLIIHDFHISFKKKMIKSKFPFSFLYFECILPLLFSPCHQVNECIPVNNKAYYHGHSPTTLTRNGNH